MTVETKKDVFKYWVGTTIKPQELGLTKGYYVFGATVEVGTSSRSKHECGQSVFGYGYIGEQRVQIAEQPNV